jgi:hypothetical protein
MRFPALRVAAACLSVLPVMASPALASDERGSFLDERSGHDEPLRFRAENGGAFRPRAVVVAGAGGALAARLPGAANAMSENRVDLSNAPVLGPLFRSTLDVASVREGALVGPVYRVGDTLVVDAGAAPAEVVNRRVAISTNIPRYGAVSYQLGRLDWAPAAPPAVAGEPIGSAHIVGRTLVLASRGGEPGWPSVEALFRDLF